MGSEIQTAKQVLRIEVLGRLRALSAADRASASARARERLKLEECWRTARSVLFYAPIDGEVDIWPLALEAWADGKTIALPRFVRAEGIYEACVVNDLGAGIKEGRFGIREPRKSEEDQVLKQLDLLLVPGVAFDLLGRRLGRGKGYYDRLLEGLSGLNCGVAFDEQIVNEVPVISQDRRMDCILTPRRWITCNQRRDLE